MPRSRILFLAIVGVAVVIVVIMGVVRPQVEQGSIARETAVVETATAVAAQAAVANSTARMQTAVANTTTIYVNYGTEKEAWFEAAVERFEAVNPGIHIVLRGQGSMSSYQDLAALRDNSAEMRGNNPIPTLWSPASEIQVNLLNQSTNSPTTLGRDLAIECQDLVLSPLAIMAWDTRADAFRSVFPQGINFSTLGEALGEPYNGRWGELGGDANWGLVKFGYTNPQESNSGVMMLMALASNYYEQASRVTGGQVTTQEYEDFVTTISNAVSQPLIPSTGTLMQQFIARGPGAYDFVVVYEALIIEQYENARGRQQQGLQIMYPPFNLYSDHPQCLIDHPSNTPAQRQAAEQFQAFLLSREIQELALTYGFRPADLGVPIFGANTPFDRPELQAAGLSANVGQIIDIPDGATINTLLQLWQRNYTGS